MVLEEALNALSLNWSIMVILIFVFGVGYIGLMFLETLKGENIYKMPLFDKIMRVIILGFSSLWYSLSNSQINLTSDTTILEFIAAKGLGLFISTLGQCLILVFLLYIIVYNLIPDFLSGNKSETAL